mmetsp:Transcript_65702/g.122493  ORF Transcript_65702/g.122493 Transcript_65702/m.122493 type:complete len:223 (-) Transcript_65702:109-777(-)
MGISTRTAWVPSLQTVNKCSPTVLGSISSGIGGKPHVRICLATLSSPIRESCPSLATSGNSGAEFATSTAAAPARAALCAFKANGTPLWPGGPPRCSKAIWPGGPAGTTALPDLSGGPAPQGSSLLKYNCPHISTPPNSPFHSARCVWTWTGSLPSSCNVNGCKSVCCTVGAARMSSKRSSSNSIITTCGRVSRMTALTSTGARGEMWSVATMYSSLPSMLA